MEIIKSLTIKDVAEGLRNKEFSAKEIFDHYQIKIRGGNKNLNAYLSTLDYRPSTIDNGKPLAGVPCAIKDNILIENTRCTAGSKILKNYISAYDATIVKKLRSAGVQF